MKSTANWIESFVRLQIEVLKTPLPKAAKDLECSVSTLQAYCKTYGIRPQIGGPRKTWPIDKIRHWVEVEGRTHKWVGAQIGCTSSHVGRICRKNGIKTQRSGPRSGEGHPEWKGGRILISGYWYIYSPDHPNRTKQNRVAEHRLVMEKKIERYLTRKEVVHHLDGNTQNNDPENLMLFRSNAEHLKIDLKGRVPNWTPEGYQKMLEAAQRKTIRAKLKRDGCQHK